jgi:hypothetical protein
MMRPVVAPAGTKSVIDVAVLLLNVVCDFVPNCTLVTSDRAVPSITTVAPTGPDVIKTPDVVKSRVILGAAELFVGVEITGGVT